MASIITNLNIIILSLFYFISAKEKLKGIYLATLAKNFENAIKNNLTVSRFAYERFKSLKSYRKYFFKIIPVNSDLYLIESLNSKKILSSGFKNNLRYVTKNDNNYKNEFYWNIIKLKENEYLIQNYETKKFLESNFFRLKCSNDTSININKKNYKNIPSKYLFNLTKLYEEDEVKPEYLNYINKEPVDVVIKYIDLSDKTLNRTGIHQIFKDEDHEELRYSVRSIFENIPWFRKIFVVMPNEKV